MTKYHLYNTVNSEYLCTIEAPSVFHLPKIPIAFKFTNQSLPEKKLELDENYFFSLLLNQWVIDKKPVDNPSADYICSPSVAKINPSVKMSEPYPNVFVFDNILLNPEEVRQEALNSKFTQRSVFNGLKSPNYDTSAIVAKVRELTGIPLRPTEKSHCVYKINKASDEFLRNGIHCDRQSGDKGYAGILYLNLPEECQGGTSIFRHKVSGATKRTEIDHDPELRHIHWIDGRYRERWDELFCVQMKYNRLGIYPSQYFHEVTKFFDGRLVMTIFMTDETDPTA